MSIGVLIGKSCRGKNQIGTKFEATVDMAERRCLSPENTFKKLCSFIEQHVVWHTLAMGDMPDRQHKL